MPLYEYRCERCGKVFEVLQKFSDAPLETHADCGGHVERLISAPAFQFKGSGWYVTDYAHGSSPPKEGSESKGETKTESKTESTKTETKSESKTESKSESKSPAPAKNDS
jgi:putative FmdB family regulatory protein